jgi:hypothetical protein
MTVAAPRIATVQLVGGIYDGAYVDVPLDENGDPPDVRMYTNTSAADHTMDPGRGPIARVITHIYERTLGVGPNGPTWYYRHVADDMGQAAA